MSTKLYTTIIIAMITAITWSQSGQIISGNVADDTGQGLPGANILVKGSTIGTQTDFDGNYSIAISAGSVLVFSYVGFTNQEVTVGTQTEINIQLAQTANDLDEVVVVGYGNQKRSDITGAVVTVKADEIAKQPAVTALQSIQGKVAGVNIIASDAPGSTPTVLVRGLGTALGGRSPFYVVDGQPLQDISSINPNDIESIDFLKGASYANIYGIRAANGVILITTKKGKEGKTQFRFDSYYGARTVLNTVKMANANQYVQYFNEENDGINNGYQLQSNQPYDTDWFDELLQTGLINNNSFSVSGAGENINYFFSYNLFQEEGIIKDAKYQRGTIRNNNTYKLFDNKVRIIQNLQVTYTRATPKPFGAFDNAYHQAPIVPVRYPENGRFGRNFVNSTTGVIGFEGQPGERIRQLNNVGNPVADVFFADDLLNTTTLQGQVSAEFDITENLMATARFGATKGYTKTKNFDDTRKIWINADPRRTEEQFEAGRIPNATTGVVRTEFANNSFRITDTEFYRWNVDAFLTYTQSFGKHNLSATVGATRENFGGGENLTAQAFDVQGQRRLRTLESRGSLFDVSANQDTNQSTNIQSYFGRVEYDFDKKYYLRGVLRRDGTSDFITGEDNFFDYFPAVSGGWTLSNEEFLQDNNLISNFKIFAGWGKLGNANVPINVQQINSGAGSGNTNYVFGPLQSNITGAAFGSPTLPISWEVTEEFEAGFDFGFLNQKLSGTLTYYNRLNTNAIIQAQNLLNSANEGNFLAQAAEVNNRGVEGLINWRDNIGNDFSYSLGVNFSTNKNEVRNVSPGFDGQLGGPLDYGARAKRLKEGEPIFAWWLYETDGVWQTQEEIDANTSIGGAQPGHLKYKDQNGDGAIDERDRKYFGSYIPTFNYGVNLGFNYKNLDFSVDGFGVGGNSIYNGLSNSRNGGENIPEVVFLNRWTGPGSTNENPGAKRDRQPSNYYLEDGDYFRINNITLGYTLDNLSVFTKTRVYATVQNAFMFTKYSGFTPELNSNGAPAGATGIELNAYPTTRTFIFGVNLQL